MEIFAQVLQGSYAYLLIFQIILVSTLFLVLVGLIIRRTKEAAVRESHTTEVMAPAGDQATPTDSAAPSTSKVEGENAPAEAAGGDSKVLSEKIKFLESKLLEYEILQEEIGTLSALKLENEQLRKKVGLSSDSGEASSSTAPPTEAKTEPTSLAEGAEVVEPATGDTPVLEKALVFDGPEGLGSPAGIPTANEPSPSLENLLQQIDELTKRPPEVTG
jgi:hypothetical protein